MEGRGPGGQRPWLGLLLALALVRGLIYAAVIPPWQGPDETGHFEAAWLIARLGRLPEPADASRAYEVALLGSLYEWQYGKFIGRPLPETMPERLDDLPTNIFARNSRPVLHDRFSLSYLWQALFLLPFRSQDLAFQLLVARCSSIALNLGIVWLAFLTFRELAPGRAALPLLMTAVVVFLPQHTFVNSALGDGPLAELMACLALYGWVRLFRRGRGLGEALAILLGTVAAIWSKATAVYLVPVDVVLAVWWLLRWPVRTRAWRQVIAVSLGLAILGLVVWLWAGSSIASKTLLSAEQSLSPEVWTVEDARGLFLGEALLTSYNSFWASFGWMALPVRAGWYGAILFLTVAAGFGWAVWSTRRREFAPWTVVMMGGALLAATAIFVWIALVAVGGGYYNVQGRYLFPALIPFSFLLVGGWSQLLRPGLETALGLGATLALVGFDAWCMLVYILPYFYFR